MGALGCLGIEAQAEKLSGEVVGGRAGKRRPRRRLAGRRERDSIPGSIGSLVTRRWRKADSNSWSRGPKYFGCSQFSFANLPAGLRKISPEPSPIAAAHSRCNVSAGNQIIAAISSADADALSQPRGARERPANLSAESLPKNVAWIDLLKPEADEVAFVKRTTGLDVPRT
jgi:hypothetical protein